MHSIPFRSASDSLSARPGAGSCLIKRTNSFDIPPGPYFAIDVPLVAFSGSSKHPNSPTRILAVATHSLSAIATPCHRLAF